MPPQSKPGTEPAPATAAVAALFKDLPQPFDEGVMLMLEEDIDLLSALVMEMNLLEKRLAWGPPALVEKVVEVRSRLMEAIRAKMDLMVALPSPDL